MTYITDILEAAEEEGIYYIKQEIELISFLLSLPSNNFVHFTGESFTCLYVKGETFDQLKTFALLGNYKYDICEEESILEELGETSTSQYIALMNYEGNADETMYAFMRAIHKTYPNQPITKKKYSHVKTQH